MTGLQVNLHSVFRLCQIAGRAMLERRQGKIINIASLLSFQRGIHVPASAASNGGVAQLTKALANEWAARNVQVNAIALDTFARTIHWHCKTTRFAIARFWSGFQLHAGANQETSPELPCSCRHPQATTSQVKCLW
jgi:NAD(P)-dependent dehydrogenase (short-subunit alcohol dehydrogenase family)